MVQSTSIASDCTKPAAPTSQPRRRKSTAPHEFWTHGRYTPDTQPTRSLRPARRTIRVQRSNQPPHGVRVGVALPLALCDAAAADMRGTPAFGAPRGCCWDGGPLPSPRGPVSAGELRILLISGEGARSGDRRGRDTGSMTFSSLVASRRNAATRGFVR